MSLRFCIVNHWDTGTLAASSAASGLPVGNTRLTARGSPWRSISSADAWQTNVEDGSLAANFVAVFGHNLAGGTIRARLYSDAAMTSVVHDSTALAVPAASASNAAMNYGLGGSASAAQAADDLFGNVQPFVHYFSATVFRATRLDFHGGSLATSYLQTGHTWAGMYHNSEQNAAAGAQFGLLTNTQASRTRGGSRRANRGETWRHFDLSLDAMKVDRAIQDDLLRYAELSGNIFVSVFAGNASARLERDYCIDGALATPDPLIHNITYVNKHLVVEEL